MAIRVDMNELKDQQRQREREENQTILDRITPWLRATMAFCIYMRFGQTPGGHVETSISSAHAQAEMFIRNLKNNL